MARVDFTYEGPEGEPQILYSPDLAEKASIFIKDVAEGRGAEELAIGEKLFRIGGASDQISGLHQPSTHVHAPTQFSSARAYSQSCGGCGKSGKPYLNFEAPKEPYFYPNHQAVLAV